MSPGPERKRGRGRRINWETNPVGYRPPRSLRDERLRDPVERLRELDPRDERAFDREDRLRSTRDREGLDDRALLRAGARFRVAG